MVMTEFIWLFGRFLEKMCFIVMKMAKSGPTSSLNFSSCIILFLHFVFLVKCDLDMFLCMCLCVSMKHVTTNGKQGFWLWGRKTVTGSAVVPLCSVMVRVSFLCQDVTWGSFCRADFTLQLTNLRCLWERWAWLFLYVG